LSVSPYVISEVEFWYAIPTTAVGVEETMATNAVINGETHGSLDPFVIPDDGAIAKGEINQFRRTILRYSRLMRIIAIGP